MTDDPSREAPGSPQPEPHRPPTDSPPVEPPPSTPPVAMPPYDQPLIDTGLQPEPAHEQPGAPGHRPAPPGYPPQDQPQPTRNSNRTAWLIAVIVIGAVLALCCLGGGVAGFFVYRSAQQAPAADATRAFINDLRAGDSGDAYNKLCPATKGAFPEPMFASIVASEPQISSYEITSRDVNRVDGVQTANITAKLRRASGAVDNHTFLLRRERGKWLVCGQPY